MQKMMICSVLLLFSLTACAQNPLNAPIVDTDPSADSSKQYLDTDRYLVDFPPYDYTGEHEASFGDRYFKLEVTPKTIAEALVSDQYFYDIAGEFDQLSDLYGANESLKLSVNNSKRNFIEGDYIRTYIIHSLETVSKEALIQMLQEDSSLFAHLDESITSFDLTKCTLVRADFYMAHSAEGLRRGPQLGDGDYTRLFLCGVTSEDAQWKIYELYWP